MSLKLPARDQVRLELDFDPTWATPGVTARLYSDASGRLLAYAIAQLDQIRLRAIEHESGRCWLWIDLTFFEIDADQAALVAQALGLTVLPPLPQRCS